MKKAVFLFILIFAPAASGQSIRYFGGGCCGPHPSAPTVVADSSVIADQTPPAMTKGVWAYQPYFGARVLQVTNSAMLGGGQGGVAYSYWRTLSKDDTWLLETGSGKIIGFDPVTERLTGTVRDLPAVPGTGFSSWEDAWWSMTDADKLYAHRGNRIYRYSVASDSWTLVKDFSATWPGKYFFQMHVSDDDDRFSFIVRDESTFAVEGFAAWDRSADFVLVNIATSGYCQVGMTYDEPQIDKSGRWLTSKCNDISVAANIEMHVYDLDSGTPATPAFSLTAGTPNFAPGHSDAGFGNIVGEDNWNDRLTVRSLSNPTSFSALMPSIGVFTHMSCRNQQSNSWCIVSTFGDVGAVKYKREIIAVKMDGSGQIKRFMHNYAVYSGDYDNSPRANVSHSGKYVAFTSNFGTGRRDLFLGRVPDEIVNW